MKNSRALTKGFQLLALPGALLCATGLSHAVDIQTHIGDVQIQNKIYGFLNAEVESVEATGGATPYVRRGRVSDGNSRLGFSGSIAVDENTSGLWQLEGSLNNFDQGGVNDQGTSSTLTSRNSFVGLEDKRFGRVILGNNDSAYRSLVGSGGELGGNQGMSTHGLDLWNNTTAQMTGNTNSIFGRGEARYKNSIHYFSPSFYGLQGAASYGFDEARTNGTNHDRFSLALKYTRGPFEIGAAFDHQQNAGADVTRLTDGLGFAVDSQNGVNTTFFKAIASYKLPTRTYVGVGYEQGRYGYTQIVAPTAGSIYSTVQTGRMNQGSAMVSLAQDVGDKGSLLLSYGKLGKLSNAVIGAGNDYSATQVSVGGQYNFNTWLSTYAYVTRINNKSGQSVDLGESPIYSNSSNTSAAYLAPGDSPRAIGVGVIARF